MGSTLSILNYTQCSSTTSHRLFLCSECQLPAGPLSQPHPHIPVNPFKQLILQKASLESPNWPNYSSKRPCLCFHLPLFIRLFMYFCVCLTFYPTRPWAIQGQEPWLIYLCIPRSTVCLWYLEDTQKVFQELTHSQKICLKVPESLQQFFPHLDSNCSFAL